MSLNSSTLFKSIAIIAILLLCSCTKIGSSTCLTTNPTTWNLSESLISTLNMINSTSTSAAKTIFTNMSVGGTPLTSIILWHTIYVWDDTDSTNGFCH